MNARLITGLIYVNAFIVGSVLMGFEMLGSRYLFPYFGGGIGTWAGLISTVLGALTIGYFVGGIMVDRHPSPYDIPIAVAAASLYLFAVPATADTVMAWVLAVLGEGPTGILFAAGALLLVPVTFLGMLSPMSMRLLLHSTAKAGRVSGTVYGVSTIGNVFGTLFTTFALIPNMGSRSTTYLFAGLLAFCAVSLFVGARKVSK